MQRNQTISWLEILIIDLALILAIGAIGASRASQLSPDRATASTPAVQTQTVVASR
ncbi:hypothetical protein BH09PLA1_BH09PLA1_24230 [soil metagenome]